MITLKFWLVQAVNTSVTLSGYHVFCRYPSIHPSTPLNAFRVRLAWGWSWAQLDKQPYALRQSANYKSSVNLTFCKATGPASLNNIVKISSHVSNVPGYLYNLGFLCLIYGLSTLHFRPSETPACQPSQTSDSDISLAYFNSVSGWMGCQKMCYHCFYTIFAPVSPFQFIMAVLPPRSTFIRARKTHLISDPFWTVHLKLRVTCLFK